MKSSRSFATIASLLFLASALPACDRGDVDAAKHTPRASDASGETHGSSDRSLERLHEDLEGIRRELVAIREGAAKGTSAAAPGSAESPAPAGDWLAIVHETESHEVASAVTKIRLQLWREIATWEKRASQPEPKMETGEAVSPDLCHQMAQHYRDEVASMDDIRTLEALMAWETEHKTYP
ncbi:MAG: hypothetical protein HYR85_10100 [Planctomycetes bacterium]|nr:hypothetical protein [Planctomycetota bacterium]MBI3846619.1 hypothetical protein [Planctomycetota bacterium]